MRPLAALALLLAMAPAWASGPAPVTREELDEAVALLGLLEPPESDGRRFGHWSTIAAPRGSILEEPEEQVAER